MMRQRYSDSLHYTFFFFFNDTATTEIYTLSLHDALPISLNIGGATLIGVICALAGLPPEQYGALHVRYGDIDRKSTRLNSSHPSISYAVFCLKKKKTKNTFQ